jgi:hypothetical protein
MVTIVTCGGLTGKGNSLRMGWGRAIRSRFRFPQFSRGCSPMALSNPIVVLSLWCSQPILQSAVALILWRRKSHKEFPVFFLFLLAQIAIFVIIFPLWLVGNLSANNSNNDWFTGYYTLYFGLFWLGEAVNAILGFKVIHEVFLDVFRPYHTLKDLGTLLFRWAGIVMLLVSVVVAFANSYEQSPLVHVITTLHRSVRIVQVGLILFLILFSRFLGVSRKQISFGISLGFGLFAGVELMLMVLKSGGLVKEAIFDTVNMVAYNVAILVWLGYSLSRKTVRQAAVNHLQTQRWEQGLADLEPSASSDSLIPMFEGMVERAFSRSSHEEFVESQPSPPLSGPAAAPKKSNSAAAGSKLQP